MPINFCQSILNILSEYENGHDLQINETITLGYEDNDNIMLLSVIFGVKMIGIVSSSTLSAYNTDSWKTINMQWHKQKWNQNENKSQTEYKDNK